jgi:4-deoxy-L-threo-5-hexosulose-uronate ketol-isomerase
MITTEKNTITADSQNGINHGEASNPPMEVRHAQSQREVMHLNTDELRQAFLMEDIAKTGAIKSVYSHYDRLITGTAVPTNNSLSLPNYPELKSNFFLERREMGIINVGGNGSVIVDGEDFPISRLECLYIGKGAGKATVSFKSQKTENPAVFYFVSAPAHKEYPTTKLTSAKAEPVEMGSSESANERTVYKYIHSAGIPSCQLVMGLTQLKPGSVWNTMPAHVHDRRSEVYFYFDVKEGNRVVHFMGEPTETRHLFVANHQAVVSPPWSIHAGCGTASYSFVWAMAGENYSYTDMDKVGITEMR